MESLYRRYQDRGLAVVAVDFQEARTKVEAWVNRHGLTVPVVLDPDGAVTDAYQVRATPTVVLVGRDGRVVGRVSGTRPWTSDAGRALIEALLR